MPQQSQYIIASVDRALQLLLLLEKTSSAMGITEIGKSMGIHKSTVHSLLQTLSFHGFVQQNEFGKYTLGARLIELGNTCAQRLDVKTIAHPLMLDLATESGEIVLLAILAQQDLIIVDKVEPPRSFLIIPKIDFHVAVHSTAIGKVLLAYSSDDITNEFFTQKLRQFTSHTITEQEILRNDFEAVRNQGYACCCNETIEGITCIAVPIFNNKRKIEAALSVSCTSSSITAARKDELTKKLFSTASLISQQLGGTNNF